MPCLPLTFSSLTGCLIRRSRLFSKEQQCLLEDIALIFLVHIFFLLWYFSQKGRAKFKNWKHRGTVPTQKVSKQQTVAGYYLPMQQIICTWNTGPRCFPSQVKALWSSFRCPPLKSGCHLQCWIHTRIALTKRVQGQRGLASLHLPWAAYKLCLKHWG